MKTIKLYLIHLIDMFDAYILRHCFHPWLCTKIMESEWWGEKEESCDCWYCKKGREGFEDE